MDDRRRLVKKHGIILANDLTDRKKALAVCEKAHGLVDAVKIGYPLALSAGLEIIKEINKFSVTIADFKVADIPETNKLICEKAFEAGVSAIIVHGFTGRRSLEACIDMGKRYGGEVYVVVEMSHEGGDEFFRPVSEILTKIALEYGADGIIAPATRPEAIKNARNTVKNLKILSPGVGAQGGSIKSAMDAGADFVIVGRSIYNADDPRSVLMKLIEDTLY